MPIYEYQCEKCNGVSETVFRVSDYASEIDCFHCGGRAFKIISKPQNMKPMWEEYFDENLGALITSREQRKRLMKEQGLVEKSISSSELRERKQKLEHRKREAMKNG